MPHALRVLGYRIAELLKVCAVYLGIAVLVTLVMVFTLAPLRTQVQQIHYALLNTLRPASVDNVLYAMLVSGDDDNRAMLESLLGIAALPPTDTESGEGEQTDTTAAVAGGAASISHVCCASPSKRAESRALPPNRNVRCAVTWHASTVSPRAWPVR